MRLKLEHQNIFITSDYHVFHNNKLGGIIHMDKRPFKDLDEMHETLINNWNNVVNDDSIVFYLGDISFGRLESTIWFLKQLKGKIYLVKGNHDDERILNKISNNFQVITDYIKLSVKDEENPRKWQDIIMSHYPILSWDKSHYSAYMLHGHCHHNLYNNELKWLENMNLLSKFIPEDNKELFKSLINEKHYYKRKVLDIGCNGHNYTPLSYQQIKDIMNNKEVINVDHHE